MRVELHPEADAEFAAQVQYYDDRQPGLGERFHSEVITSLEWIAENPTVPPPELQEGKPENFPILHRLRSRGGSRVGSCCCART